MRADRNYFILEGISEVIAVFHTGIQMRGHLQLEKVADGGQKLLRVSRVVADDVQFGIGLLIFPKGLLYGHSVLRP